MSNRTQEQADPEMAERRDFIELMPDVLILFCSSGCVLLCAGVPLQPKLQNLLARCDGVPLQPVQPVQPPAQRAKKSPSSQSRAALYGKAWRQSVAFD